MDIERFEACCMTFDSLINDLDEHWSDESFIELQDFFRSILYPQIQHMSATHRQYLSLLMQIKLVHVQWPDTQKDFLDRCHFLCNDMHDFVDIDI